VLGIISSGLPLPVAIPKGLFWLTSPRGRTRLENLPLAWPQPPPPLALPRRAATFLNLAQASAVSEATLLSRAGSCCCESRASTRWQLSTAAMLATSTSSMAGKPGTEKQPQEWAKKRLFFRRPTSSSSTSEGPQNQREVRIKQISGRGISRRLDGNCTGTAPSGSRVADYSNPQLTNRARDRIAHLEANTAQRNGGGQRTGRTNPPAQAPQARARQNGRRKRNRKLRRRRGPSVAAAGLGLEWTEEEGGREQRPAGGRGERAAEVYVRGWLICRIGRGVFGKASLSVGTRSQQCQRQRSGGTCHGVQFKKNTKEMVSVS
jgi:hypothetical protein